MALFLEDDENLVFVFLSMKIKVALGGVIHQHSTNIEYWGSRKSVEVLSKNCFDVEVSIHSTWAVRPLAPKNRQNAVLI